MSELEPITEADCLYIQKTAKEFHVQKPRIKYYPIRRQMKSKIPSGKKIQSRQITFNDEGTIWTVATINKILDGRTTPEKIPEYISLEAPKDSIVIPAINSMKSEMLEQEIDITFESNEFLEEDIKALFQVHPVDFKQQITLIDVGVALQEMNVRNLKPLEGDFSLSPLQMMWIYAINMILKHGN